LEQQHDEGNKEPFLGSILYSDVGRTYYSKMGWYPHSTRTTFIHLNKDATLPWIQEAINSNSVTSTNTSALNTNLKVEKVDSTNLPKIMSYDRKLTTSKAISKIQSDGRPTLVVYQTTESVQWAFGRSEYYAQALSKTSSDGEKIPQQIGCVISAPSSPSSADPPSSTNTDQETTKENLSYILWFHEFRFKELYILRLESHNNNTEHTKLLLQYAVQEAKKWGLEKVEVWGDLPWELHGDVGSDSAKAVETFEREESIPSLYTKIQPPLEQHHHDSANAGAIPLERRREWIDWIFNEKGLWC
jgi:hypothetical protein